MTRYEQLLEQLERLNQGEISEGDLLAHMRKRVLKKSQEDYAAIVSVSRRTLSDIERGRGNVSIETLNRVFHPIGLRMGLTIRNTQIR